MYRIFTAKHPGGFAGVDDLLAPETIACVETTGVARVKCWCCDRKIVVRRNDASLTADDHDFLGLGAGRC